jgi:ribosomal protein L30/L7E
LEMLRIRPDMLQREKIRLSREAKKSDSIYVPAENKLVFVVRIKGINKIDPKKRKTLQLLRLLQINSGVFIKLTKATSEMLKSTCGSSQYLVSPNDSRVVGILEGRSIDNCPTISSFGTAIAC